MTEEQEKLLTNLGFRFGINGPHAARTMMLEDLRTLLANTPAEAKRKDYADAVVSENLLGKPTKKSRELAFRHLLSLYGLETSNPLFRALRRLWPLDPESQPLLALTVALVRDPLLRGSVQFILSKQIGSRVPRADVEALLSQQFPERFSPASLKSFAQNVAGTWTDAGYLSGRQYKTRVLPSARPEATALALFVGHLEGRSGQRLFSSEWMTLLGGTSTEQEALTSAAAHRGLLVFMNAGGVKELRFPGYLTAEEEQFRQEAMNVI